MEWVAFPPLGALPDTGIEPRSPKLQANSLPSEPPGVDSYKISVSSPFLNPTFMITNYLKVNVFPFYIQKIH